MTMAKYVEIKSNPVADHAHDHQVWLKVGNQSFMVGVPFDELHDAEFIRNMLVLALGKIVAENTVSGAATTKEPV
jgi:hypothetical protein